MTDPFDVSGQVALVTGASQGLGERFARVLAARGAHVALAARNVDKLTALGGELSTLGVRCHPVALDVTDEGSIAAAVGEAEEVLGPIDILVNNAGVAVTKPFLEQTAEDWDKVVGTNLRGAFLVAKAVAAHMAPRGRGTIVNIESVLGYSVLKALAPYAASKAGLGALTRAMALELARDGVRVNGLAPGYVETDINRDFFATEAGERLKKQIPFRRIGRPEDLDGAFLLLASPASAYMTGSTVVVDGGFLLQ